MKQSWLRQFGFHVRRLLQEFDFMKDLEPSVANSVADVVHRAQGQSGDVCFREGDPPEYLYIIIVGYVMIWQEMELEDEDDAPEARYSEGSIEAQLQCGIMESMLREREAERAAQLEKAAAENAAQQRAASASGKKRKGNVRVSTKVDMEPQEAAEGASGKLALPRDAPGGGSAGSDGTTTSRSRQSFCPSPDEEESPAASRRPSRPSSPCPPDSPAPSLGQRRSRATVVDPLEFAEEDDYSRSPSASSTARRSLKQGTAVDVRAEEEEAPSRRGSKTTGRSSTSGQAPPATPAAHVGVRSAAGARKTIDEAMAEASVSSEHGLAAAAVASKASRRPGPDETFGVHIATLGPGSFFGETALLEDSPRSASVTCKGPCQFLVIGREDFERTLKEEIKKLKLQKLAGPVRHLLSTFKFFQELAQHVQKAVIDIVRYSHHAAGTVFFRQDDPPGSCYIVLSGTVSVWINKVDSEEAGHTSPKTPVRKTLEAPRRASEQVASTITAALVAKLSSTAYGGPRRAQRIVADGMGADESKATQVALLGPGALFGELALLTDAPRSATVVCEEDCEIFSINRHAFESVLKSSMSKERRDIPKYGEAIVEHLPVFTSMRPLVRQSVPFIMRHRAESEGTVLWFSGDVLSQCFILLTGEVCFWEETVVGNPFEPVLVDAGSEEVCEKCAELAGLLAAKEDEDGSTPVAPRPGKASEEPPPRKTQGVYGFKSRVVQAGVLFGEDALFDGQPVTSTCVCQADCMFLVISKRDFDNVLREEIRMEKVKKAASQVRRVLTEFPIFRELAPAVIDALPSVAHYRVEKSGHVLFSQGEPADYCYIVLAGEVMAWRLEVCDEEAQEDPEGEDAASGQRRLRKQHSQTVGQAPRQVARPPPVSLAVRDMCGALSMMLAMAESNEEREAREEREGLARNPRSKGKKQSGKPLAKGSRKGDLDDKSTWALGMPVAAMGPGSIVGELALVTEKPRHATITCEEDCCHFLAIEKADFDRILKQEMRRAKDSKLEFLKQHVPNFKSLKDSAAESAVYYFKHGTFPRSHRFFSKGGIADGSIHIVWKGAVEVTSENQRPSSRPNSRSSSTGSAGTAPADKRLGMLLRGSTFVSLPLKCPLPFSAISASSVCEVLSVTAENLALLPEVVQRGLREQADHVMARRTAALSPPMSPCRTPTKASSGRLHSRTAEANTLPRVMSSGLTSKLNLWERDADQPYPFCGLFKGEPPPMDFREFNMLPGECLAMKGRVPMKRSKRLEAGSRSPNLPSAWGPPGSPTAASPLGSSMISSANTSIMEVLAPFARPASRGAGSRPVSRCRSSAAF